MLVRTPRGNALYGGDSSRSLCVRRVSVCLKIIVWVVSCVCFAASAPHTAKPNGWAQLAELTPTNRNNQDWFGVSVAVSGDTVVVGAFDSNIETTGTAYVFVKTSGGWRNMTQTAILTPSDGGAGFGTSVAISGDTIIVGAANASNLDFQTPQQQGPGAAYLSVKPPTGWTDITATAKL